MKRLANVLRENHPILKKVYYTYLNIRDKVLYRNVIRTLIVISGQKCSLHCKNCANFSPYQPSELAFYNADDIIADLEKITKNAAVQGLQFQGGEFFLHKDAAKLLSYANSNKRLLCVTVATNATVMPNDECLKLLANKKMRVRISNYGVANEKSAEKLAAILKESDVYFFHHKYANQNLKWSDCGGRDFAKLSPEQALENYKNCMFKQCLTLENGVVSRCSRATVAHHIQGFTPAATDFVDVRSPNFQIQDLMEYDIHTSKTIRITGGGAYYCLFLLQRHERQAHTRWRAANA